MSLPGEARIEGKFPDWSPDRAYTFVRYALRKEGSRFLEEHPPVSVVAAQGKGRLVRTFEISLEPVATGTWIRIRITSPEDWPVHARAALRHIATGLAVSTLGFLAITLSLANRLGDLPTIGAILLLAAGAPVIVVGWARFRHAKMLMRGQATALLLQ